MTLRFLLLLPCVVIAGCATAKAGGSVADAKFGSIKETYATFKEALAKEDYDTAYDALSKDTRERYPSQIFWFAFNMTGTGQEYRQLIAGSTLVTAVEKSDGASAVAVLRARHGEGGHYLLKSFRLMKEDGKWRVAFTLKEFFGIDEEKFFDLGKVAEKRDFRQRR